MTLTEILIGVGGFVGATAAAYFGGRKGSRVELNGTAVRVHQILANQKIAEDRHEQNSEILKGVVVDLKAVQTQIGDMRVDIAKLQEYSTPRRRTDRRAPR